MLTNKLSNFSCCWYHKGTNFQANHNKKFLIAFLVSVVADTTKVRIFKQITTTGVNALLQRKLLLIPQRYEFSSKSQHVVSTEKILSVVADTTKVRIFKQITTSILVLMIPLKLLLIPQRYEFSSKSQPAEELMYKYFVVADTTKVRIFKQITT